MNPVTESLLKRISEVNAGSVRKQSNKHVLAKIKKAVLSDEIETFIQSELDTFFTGVLQKVSESAVDAAILVVPEIADSRDQLIAAAMMGSTSLSENFRSVLGGEFAGPFGAVQATVTDIVSSVASEGLVTSVITSPNPLKALSSAD